MPKLNTEIGEGADNIELRVPYEITNVSEVVTEVGFYKGIRVELFTANRIGGSLMLWQRPVTSRGSKLGSFITLLGDDTDDWLGKWIVFTTWEKTKRNVALVDAPKKKG